MEVEAVVDPVEAPDADVSNADVGAVEHKLAESRTRLDELARALAVIDAQIEALADDRRRRDLLQDICRALDELQQMGGAELFWQGPAAGAGREAHMAQVRSHIASFEARLAEIDARRRALLDEIGQQHQQHFLLEDEAFEAMEEEEKRLNEWIIEREMQAIRARPNALAWARGGDDDRRFRKTLAGVIAACLLLMLLLPFVELPVRGLEEDEQLVERVVTVIPEVQKLREAPPPPEFKPREKVAERKPAEKPEPARVAEVPQVEAPPQEQGLLAFRESLAQVKDVSSLSKLGKSANIREEDSSRQERSMLTTNNPGSSGGIQLGSTSRGFGESGGSERGAISGTALTQASSGINAIAPAARPLSGGPGLSRTDEEIQIVFDRHKAALYRLYNRELRRDPTLQGKIVLRLTIEPDGSVSMSQLVSTEIDAPELAAQVVTRVRSFDFGAKDVPAITIVYPIDFLPAA